jgi:transcriptional regulator with XRE-family HTH domain
MDLGLTQEDLAARMGGSASQAEISRLERGTIALPRRARLDALAAALEVSIGALLVHSGWLTDAEAEAFDSGVAPLLPAASADTEAMLEEVMFLQATLLAAVERVGLLERTIRSMAVGRRPDVNLPAGIFDDWEQAAVLV